jgi:PAS domain-containing protein
MSGAANKDSLRARWLRRGLDTHVSLPLFAMLLLVAIWLVSFHEIEAEREHAQEAAADSLREMLGTYEAQVARSLDGIDQTLRVLKYAVERKGALGALPELGREGLLPPGVVFVVSIVDRNGVTVASNPHALPISVADQAYFKFHQERDSGATYVSQVTRDAANTEWHLHFTRRIDDEEGDFAGIVIVEADPAYFTSSYERSRLGERGMLGLAGADGEIRALRIGDKLSFGQRIDMRGGQVAVGDGVLRYSGMRELHGVALNVLVGLDEKELMAGFESQRREKLWESGIASAVLVFVTALVCLWSWQGARTRAHVRRAQETYAAASEARAWTRSSSCAGARRCRRNRRFRFEATNVRAEQMTGLSKKQLMAATLCDDAAPRERHLRRPGQGDAGRRRARSRVAGATAAARATWLHRQVVAVEGGVVAIVRDISERKLAEARILHMAHHDS